MFSSPFLPLPAGLRFATTSMLDDDLLVVQVISSEREIVLSALFLFLPNAVIATILAWWQICPAQACGCSSSCMCVAILLRQHGLHQEDFYGAASRLRSAVGTSHGPSLRGSSISWTGDLWRGGNPAGSSSRYSNVANNDPSSSHDAAS